MVINICLKFLHIILNMHALSFAYVVFVCVCVCFRGVCRYKPDLCLFVGLLIEQRACQELPAAIVLQRSTPQSTVELPL